MKPFRTASMMTSAELDALKMSDLLGDMANQIARKLAADQDALIRRNITRRIGDDWSDASILPRLRWEIDRSKPEKMLLLDDKPLLLIWPPDSALDMEGASANYMKWSVKYLEL